MEQKEENDLNAHEGGVAAEETPRSLQAFLGDNPVPCESIMLNPI
jgi:hypothetical protein